MKSKKDLKNIICIASLSIILFTIITFIIASAYSFLQADDFSHAMGVGVFNTSISELLTASVKYSIQMYKTWQGTYFSMFIQAFFSPLNGMGPQQLSLIMIANCILFFGTLFVLIKTICNYFFKNSNMWHVILPLYAIALFSIMNFRAWTEIFYWYSGSTSYSIPLSCLFISVIYLIKAANKNNKFYYLISCLFAFFMAGGSLEVAGTGCYFILLLILSQQIKEKNLWQGGNCVFYISFLGALLNVLAPGNYVRHGYIDSTGLHFFEAIKGSLIRYIAETDWIINNTAFICCIIVCIFMGMLNHKNIKKILVGGGIKLHAIRIALLLLLPYITIFPVELAYGGGWFPNRCQFVLDIVIVLVYGAMSLYCGYLVEEYISVYTESTKQTTFFMIILCLIAFSCSSKLTELKSYETFIQLVNSEIQGYSKQCNNVFDYIENSEEMEISIESIPASIANYPPFLLDADKTHWINTSIASYYGKEYVEIKD